MDLGRLGRFEPDFSRPLLFKRCATCPATAPPCPTCGPNEVCSLIGGGCDSCAVTLCTPIGGSSGSNNASSGKSSSPAGPIAGGVIGGIAVICIMTFFVWRFCIKKRRQQYDAQEEIWRASMFGEKSAASDFGQNRDARASMHSVRSIASTVLTRASNVIQIAYIPGITNRSVDPSTNPDSAEHIPPVPPIPAMSPGGSPRPRQAEDHYFMPSDLRDSTFPFDSEPRHSYATHTSIARSSVPSTAYRGSAIVNAMPAQTAIRGKANPVAVRTTGHNTPANLSPVIGSEQGSRIASPIVGRLGVPKAVTVTRSNGSSKHSSPVDSHQPSLAIEDESPVDRHLDAHAQLPRIAHNPTSPTISELPASPSQYRLQPVAMTVSKAEEGPFSDAHVAQTP